MKSDRHLTVGHSDQLESAQLTKSDIGNQAATTHKKTSFDLGSRRLHRQKTVNNGFEQVPTDDDKAEQKHDNNH